MQIKGITVTLYEKTQTGSDAFGVPIYTEIPAKIDNVLVAPVSGDEIVNDLDLYGKRPCINWASRNVMRTIGRIASLNFSGNRLKRMAPY